MSNENKRKEDELVKVINRDKWICVDEVIKLSENFAISYPDDQIAMRCNFLVQKFGREVIEKNINSAYPVIHESALKLYEKYLEANHDVEFYKNMTVVDFADRLLKKRAVLFFVGHEEAVFFTESVKENDDVVFSPNLKQTKKSKDGTKQIFFTFGGWESIGTSEEKEPLLHENCLTYDEIELSALLSVSSHTVFVNAGSRKNKGIYEENRENIEDVGVIIGLIGPQFRKNGVMDYKRMISPKALVEDKMDKLMREFYKCPSPKILKLKDKSSFNVSAYKKRLAVSFDTLLIEANSRAKAVNKKAFIHVVGIGLGVWRLLNEQNEIFIETFYERLKLLLGNLANVSDVRFAYIYIDQCKRKKKIGSIVIHFEDIDPHIRIGGDKLLVVSYAGDGNAMPGNEFWIALPCGSSDAAAACSTQISELLNPHINLKVCGQNLRIATPDRGTITYAEYISEKK